MTIPTQNYNPGGNFRALGVTALGFLKPSAAALAASQAVAGVPVAGTLMRVTPQAVGSAGSLVIGDVSPVAYSATAQYAIGNTVVYSGVPYYCYAVPTPGTLPTNNTYFQTNLPASLILFAALYSAMAISTPIILEVPFTTGLYVWSVPSAGSPSFNITWF